MDNTTSNSDPILGFAEKAKAFWNHNKEQILFTVAVATCSLVGAYFGTRSGNRALEGSLADMQLDTTETWMMVADIHNQVGAAGATNRVLQEVLNPQS